MAADHSSADALVIGGGPAGLATAIELGRRGHDVTVVDLGPSPHGAALLLTPRAVAASRRLGVDPVESFHRVAQVRFTHHDTATATVRSTSSPWPRHRVFPDLGVVAARSAFLGQLRDVAASVGVDLVDGEAVEPLVERGFVRGARVRTAGSPSASDLRGGVTVVADGGASRFGRSLGTYRQPEWPAAQAHAAEFESPLAELGEAEIVLGVTDRAGTPIAGYGWMFPTGGRTVSVGVMMASTSPSYQVTNPARLLTKFVDDERERWQLGGRPVTEPTGARIPLGGSVGPLAGPTWLIVGDAGAAANPFTGFGVDTALETGVLAGDVVAEAIGGHGGGALQQYPQLVHDQYAAYYHVGRLMDRLVGQPAAARRIYQAIASRRAVSDGALRIVTQHLRGGARGGGPEFAYRVARTISVFLPEA